MPRRKRDRQLLSLVRVVLPRAVLPAFLLLGIAMLTVSIPGAGVEAAERDTRPLPWRQAGLTEAQAAAHLLDRFTFGPRGPQEVAAVVEQGLEAWLEAQLAADLPEPALERHLRGLPARDASPREIAATYPQPGRLLAEARRAGVVDDELFQAMAAGETPSMEGAGGGEAGRRELRRTLRAYAREQGYRPERELLLTLASQKVLRATYAENQLAEVLTDFWFNHFHVSSQDGEARPFLLPYERDAIRPHVLGDFRSLLGATARHPAMLLYLDNARSVAEAGAPTPVDRQRARARRGGRLGRQGLGRPDMERQGQPEPLRRAPTGVNENYARELLELHTLGVDGGYTQADVEAVARAFTGWAVVPPQALEQFGRERIARARRAGFVVDEDDLFVFRADRHDAGKKTILGQRFPAGRGVEEGEAVLDLLAAHPATARHLAGKLAVLFVADQPPESLVDRLAEVFQASRGDLAAVVRELAYAPEFWSAEARAAKIKSPFELTVSALRALDAEVSHPRGLVDWLGRMGQQPYSYVAPTGWPDRADFWVNTGALLQRMNFGLALAAGRVPGVAVDLDRLLPAGPPPASRREALELLLPRLLPERATAAVIERLEPLLHEPDLARRVEASAPAPPALEDDPGMGPELLAESSEPTPGPEPAEAAPVGLDALEQVVGLILGSPEFQRR